MIALDTNVVVRFIMGDDRAQTAIAKRFIAQNDVWIGATVLLETEWVLRGGYKLPVDDVHRFLVALLGLANVHTDDPERLEQALDDFASGLDFADALHLAFANDAEALATFDRDFARRSRTRGRLPVRAL